MSGWLYKDDETRQPSGMTPLGFDADRGIHTYQDTDGSFWEGELNGPLRRVSSQKRLDDGRHSTDIESGNPAYQNYYIESYHRRKEDIWRWFIPGALLFVLLFMIFNFLSGSAPVMQNLHGSGQHPPSTSTDHSHLESLSDSGMSRCDNKPNLSAYRIHAGDSCYSIARKYDMELLDLKNLNGAVLGEDECTGMLEPGTVLCVRTTGIRC